MTSPEIPARVLQFLAERIDTVPQLEALLLLWENPQRLWSDKELAGRIYVSRPVAASILQALQRQQLVTAEPAAAVCYRYNPQRDSGGEVMSEVADRVPVRGSSERRQSGHLHGAVVLVPADPGRDRQ
jgi:hypothetical protein